MLTFENSRSVRPPRKKKTPKKQALARREPQQERARYKVALILEARRAIKLNPFLIEFLGNTDHPVHRDQHNPKGKFCGGASSDGAKAA